MDGEGYAPSYVSSYSLCMYFYLLKLGDIRAIYSSASGLWWEQRYRAVGETLLNLILNVVLGKILGVHGIILATMISLFLCNYLWSARITFQKYFSLEKLRDYYIYQGKQTLLAFAAAAATYLVCRMIPAGDAPIRLIVNLAVCIVLPNLIFIIVYRNTDSYRYASSVILRR